MPIFSVRQAETQLSQLLVQVRNGEEVVIAEGTKPVARLVPFDAKTPRRPGRLKGRIELTPAFFEPLPTDELAGWGEDV